MKKNLEFLIKIPSKKYKIHVIIKSIKRGKPRVSEPDEFLMVMIK